ncbi:uncharacterized protein MONBRDRAFT_9267 [Monosiga brevicollis MX1]|uniref:MYND-type domain-containing protein n=1 Tax=Monosiga brevicollis TaxID=81824 RepID=A9V2L5_MONBE|nr:uncharacterized protein MONBRDRAFT_9267 [Monosiga brevicollis MX1]EDQ88279.1 predicted protein [Monosiga brevicollis MX1]|eukprot:XP_001746872.1 hypothetical protein [Monosiga brevicollis MX1]
MATVGPGGLQVKLQSNNVCGNPVCRRIAPKHKCARCMSICYCSRECQLSHYSVHKMPCKAIAAQFLGVDNLRFLGFEPQDAEDRHIIMAITTIAEQLERTMPLPSCMVHPDAPLSHFHEGILPLLPAHKEGDCLIDADQTYAGVVLSQRLLQTMLLRANLRMGDVLYSITTRDGVARAVLARDPDSADRVLMYTPLIPMLRPSQGAAMGSISVASLIRWRRSTMCAHASASDLTQFTPTERASIAQELLFLADQTAFPTMQLARAMGVRGALVLHVTEHNLCWQFRPRFFLREMGEEVLRAIDNYDPDQAIVTLTMGSIISSEDNPTTVLLVNPLHVARAFHQQVLEPKVLANMRATCYQSPCQAEYDMLHARQSQKAAHCSDMGVAIDESEA